MKTVIIQWGNSDNKLPQENWSDFCTLFKRLSKIYETHFFGFSASDAPWQNGCWIFVITEDSEFNYIRQQLHSLCLTFNQESIAMTIADTTEFIS